jgi:flagellar biosynthesis protein FlhF
MQVKKFEARTMKEALEMVKVQLGPDAIILGVKDNKRSFGLVGDGSVEITAAVTDETLHKKKFAESRLRDQEKKILSNSTAKVQKEFINKMVHNYTQERQAPPSPRPVTRTRYIDIDDEAEMMANPQMQASERIRGAAQRAWNAMQVHGEWQEAAMEPQRAPKSIVPVKSESEIAVLKNEIASLRQVIKGFQAVPQTMTNAVPVTAHPGAEFGLGFEVSAMFEKLTQAGVSTEIAAEVLTLAQTQMPAVKLKNRALVDAWVARHILDTTKVTGDKNGSKIQFFVGPAGSGKTSTLIKLASHLVVNEKKKIALLTADTLKVGAAEQMRIYSQILNVPFGIIRNAADWQGVLAQLGQFDHILVDAPGLSLKSIDENTFLRNLLPPSSAQATVHLVLEATLKDSDATEIGRRYKGHGFQDVIFTGLDQSVQHGSIYNFMRKFDVPLHSFGLGTRVPEDYEMATKERVLDLIFKLTNLSINKARG